MKEHKFCRLNNPEKINKAYVAGPPELDVHRCVRVHHGDPYTKLGPIKVEVVHHSPVFYILHELFTEEDMEHLISWAKPRLSSKREIRLAEDRGKTPRNEWRTRKGGHFFIIWH